MASRPILSPVFSSWFISRYSCLHGREICVQHSSIFLFGFMYFFSKLRAMVTCENAVSVTFYNSFFLKFDDLMGGKKPIMLWLRCNVGEVMLQF